MKSLLYRERNKLTWSKGSTGTPFDRPKTIGEITVYGARMRPMYATNAVRIIDRDKDFSYPNQFSDGAPCKFSECVNDFEDRMMWLCGLNSVMCRIFFVYKIQKTENTYKALYIGFFVLDLGLRNLYFVYIKRAYRGYNELGKFFIDCMGIATLGKPITVNLHKKNVRAIMWFIKHGATVTDKNKTTGLWTLSLSDFSPQRLYRLGALLTIPSNQES